jgi:serine/threonine protein kinase
MAAGPNKFTAAPPGSGAASSSLDLAAVAEQALYDVDAEAAAPAARDRAATPAGEIHYGPYRLLQRIAVGGMAEVFRAKRTGVEGFEKVVAVKRILPHLSDNKEFVDMFIDEAKMVAGLTHPNIVQIFDLGKIDRTYFIAMDYVHGRDLRTIMRRGREKGLRIPLDLSLLVVSRVCSALEFAHRKKDERGVPMQIVHRDVSPQNILISFEGEVKLTDFGIAKAATKATVTDAGALRGKLLYMSPEQAWGKPMDRRSDVFSLGIVFYEMVTDQKPFLASSEMSILETVRECKVVPPSQVNPRIPEKLERVLLKALARDVDERYQDAAEMYRDLERVLHERQPPTSAELSRFMELLFDDPERSEVSMAPGTPAPAEPPPPTSTVHEDFESAAPAAAAPAAPAPPAAVAPEPVPVTAPPAPPEPEPEAKTPARDPMSIQKLLKRFGIK